MNKLLDGLIYNQLSRRDICRELRFDEFVNKIHLFRTAFIKMDVPYMPDDFPYEIPVGKDADIICSKGDFDSVADMASDWAGRFKERFNYDVIRINEESGTRIRINRGGTSLSG